MKKAIFTLSIFSATFTFAQTGNVIGINVGNIAPEIVMKNPNDSSIALSSLHGKMVLIDFWASWCGPCRGENPNVVKTYNGYKDSLFQDGSGFTVFSVSLDRPGGKDAWKNAIKNDGLIWPYHVSDLMGWDNAAAQKFQVFQIPTNYLIDGNGVIVAKDLHGPALAKALSTLTDRDASHYKKSGGKKKKGRKKKSKETTDAGLMGIFPSRRDFYRSLC